MATPNPNDPKKPAQPGQPAKPGAQPAKPAAGQPTPEAMKAVPQNMAELYKMLPLKIEADALTVVMSDPNNMMALDDLRNMLGIRQVTAQLAPLSKIEAALAKAYSTTKEETIGD